MGEGGIYDQAQPTCERLTGNSNDELAHGGLAQDPASPLLWASRWAAPRWREVVKKKVRIIVDS